MTAKKIRMKRRKAGEPQPDWVNMCVQLFTARQLLMCLCLPLHFGKNCQGRKVLQHPESGCWCRTFWNHALICELNKIFFFFLVAAHSWWFNSMLIMRVVWTDEKQNFTSWCCLHSESCRFRFSVFGHFSCHSRPTEQIQLAERSTLAVAVGFHCPLTFSRRHCVLLAILALFDSRR